MTDTPAEVAEKLIHRLRWQGTHMRETSRGGLEAEARTMHEAADLIADLERQLIPLKNMLLLCGEREVRDVEGYPEKLRALIDGLIDQRRRADEADRQLAEARGELAAKDEAYRLQFEACAQLAAQRERDGRDAERYRFLRDDPPVELAVRQVRDYGPRDGYSYLYLDGIELDAAIDAALKERQ